MHPRTVSQQRSEAETHPAGTAGGFNVPLPASRSSVGKGEIGANQKRRRRTQLELHRVVQAPFEGQREAGDDLGRRRRALQVGIERDAGFRSRHGESSKRQRECQYQLRNSKSQRHSHFQLPIFDAMFPESPGRPSTLKPSIHARCVPRTVSKLQFEPDHAKSNPDASSLKKPVGATRRGDC